MYFSIDVLWRKNNKEIKFIRNGQWEKDDENEEERKNEKEERMEKGDSPHAWSTSLLFPEKE